MILLFVAALFLKTYRLILLLVLTLFLKAYRLILLLVVALFLKYLQADNSVGCGTVPKVLTG